MFPISRNGRQSKSIVRHSKFSREQPPLESWIWNKKWNLRKSTRVETRNKRRPGLEIKFYSSGNKGRVDQHRQKSWNQDVYFFLELSVFFNRKLCKKYQINHLWAPLCIDGFVQIKMCSFCLLFLVLKEESKRCSDDFIEKLPAASTAQCVGDA